MDLLCYEVFLYRSGTVVVDRVADNLGPVELVVRVLLRK